MFRAEHSYSNSKDGITVDSDNCRKITDNDERVAEQQLQQWRRLI